MLIAAWLKVRCSTIKSFIRNFSPLCIFKKLIIFCIKYKYRNKTWVYLDIYGIGSKLSLSMCAVFHLYLALYPMGSGSKVLLCISDGILVPILHKPIVILAQYLKLEHPTTHIVAMHLWTQPKQKFEGKKKEGKTWLWSHELPSDNFKKE